jgi:hypothetical protein
MSWRLRSWPGCWIEGHKFYRRKGADGPVKPGHDVLRVAGSDNAGLWLRGLATRGAEQQKFFASFFQKRSAFFLYIFRIDIAAG